MSLETAMEKVASMSGSAFDPKIVEVLKRRYLELERMVDSDSMPAAAAPESTLPEMGHDPGAKPAAGYEHHALIPTPANETDFLSSIASARQDRKSTRLNSSHLGISY